MGNIALNRSSEYPEDVTDGKVYIPEDSAVHEASIGIDESGVNCHEPNTPVDSHRGCIP